MEIRVQTHGPHVAVITIDNQPRRTNVVHRPPIDMWAVPRDEWIHPIEQLGKPRRARPHVFEKEGVAIRTKDTPNLRKAAHRVRNGAEDASGDDGVERC